jgi:hypothetical protein
MVGKSSAQAGKARALESGLRGMFRSLAQRAVPDRLRSVVDQLDEGDAPPPRKAKSV